ncbi:putative acting on peptide bonds (peptidase) [Helianthus annuus]|nr:putative acting on peptide bonds (peptidase) [Helianthus annuus]
MESRTLEIVLHSAKDLYDVKFFGTMDPYATLWIDGGGGGAQEVFKQYKTNVAKKAGTCPIWDYRMEFQLHSMSSNYSLFCEIQHDGKLFDRMIGEVQVPFKDLLASKQKARYPVKRPSGEVQGEIILSHKLLDEVISNKDGISSTDKKNGTGNRKPKVHSSANKVQGKKKKKKNGAVKQFAMNVVTGVATAAIVKGVTAAAIGGTVGAGAVLATEDNIDLEDDDDDDEDVPDDDEEDDVVQDDDEDDDYDDEEDEDDDYDDEEDDDNEDDYDDEYADEYY